MGDVGQWIRGYLYTTTVGLLIVGICSKLLSAPALGRKVKALVFDHIYKRHGSLDQFNKRA